MMGKPQNQQPKLFYHGFSLENRLPKEHALRKISRLVNFAFIRSQVKHLYGINGNTSIDPAVILKLMFLMFYENSKSERVLMEQLPPRLDWLWFCGYCFDDQTPDHSVISKARRRWGQEVFSDFFANILQHCIDAGLLDGKTIHIDSSRIDGNVSKDTLKPQLCMLGQKLYQDIESQDNNDKPLQQRISQTDTDARIGKKYDKSTLGCKDHRVVDDKCGIVTATVTAPANVHDGKLLAEAIQTHQSNTDTKVKTVVADKAYGNIENYKHLKDNDIKPCIPHQTYRKKENESFEKDAFKYDSQCDCYICPAQQQLHRYYRNKPCHDNTYSYRAKRKICEQCKYFTQCVSSKNFGRQIDRNLDSEYTNWADGCLGSDTRRRLMTRRRAKAEGSFADAANNHGFKRARWRGIVKMRIQNLMIAAIQNLRKLMRHLGRNAIAAAVAAVKTGFFGLFTVVISTIGVFVRKTHHFVSEYLLFKELCQ